MEETSKDIQISYKEYEYDNQANNLQLDHHQRVVKSDSYLKLNRTDEDCKTRRVSFPKSDNELVNFFEPANPWESVAAVKNVSELVDHYRTSCQKHGTEPLLPVINHLQSITLTNPVRQVCLNLKEHKLTPASCEPLEEILKRIQYRTIDLTACGLNDMAASALFDMIEYYEAANELDISDNPDISSRGWQSCISMLRRSRTLQTLIVRGSALSEVNSANLGKSLNESFLHTLKLEHCGLTGRPFFSLCNALKKNTSLRELWLAYNDLNGNDTENLGEMLKTNVYLQFLDISNNNIQDIGVRRIVAALIEQSSNISQSVLKPGEHYFSYSTLFGSSSPKYITLDSKSDTFIKSPIKPAPGVRSMLGTLLNMNSSAKSLEQDKGAINNNANKTISTNLTEKNSTEGASNIHLPVVNLINQPDSASPTINSFESFQTASKNIILSTTDNKDEYKNNSLLDNNNLSKNEETIEHKSFDHESYSKIFDMNDNSNKLPAIISEVCTESIDMVSESTSSDSLNIVKENLNQPADKDVYDTNSFDSNVKSRSLSSESLNSENSLEINDSKLSVKHNEKLTKNDTLGRQKHSDERIESNKVPRGLQAIVLWNNNITRVSGEYISDLLAANQSLEFLNIGKNILSDDFVEKICSNLTQNSTLTNLGLQSAHLTCTGIKVLARVLQFGGNTTLQRIDIRDNNVQVLGLISLEEVLKSNKSITRLDVDDVPKRVLDNGSETQFQYTNALHTIRTLCLRNATPSENITETANKRQSSVSSRKISLTCQSLRSPLVDSRGSIRNDLNVLDVKKKSGTRLRSPLPSPPTSSPSSSPVPSPSRSRFQVFRVAETKSPSNTINNMRNTNVEKISTSPGSRFHVTIVGKSDPMVTNVQKKKSENLDIVQNPMSSNARIFVNDETNNFMSRSSSFENFSSNRDTDIVTSLTDDSFSSSSSIDSYALNQDSNQSSMRKCDSDVESSSVKDEFLNENFLLQPESVQSSSIDNLIEESEKENVKFTVGGEAVGTKGDGTDARVRKLSWISPSNYPTTVDKLLSLFNNPTNLFSKSENHSFPDTKSEHQCSHPQNVIATRKDSSHNLFTWPKMQQEPNFTQKRSASLEKSTVAPNTHLSIFDAASKQIKGFADFGKQVFKQNIALGDSIKVDQKTCASIPTEVKLEIKENISPEQTLTAASLSQLHISKNFQSPPKAIIDLPCVHLNAESGEDVATSLESHSNSFSQPIDSYLQDFNSQEIKNTTSDPKPLRNSSPNVIP